MRKIFALLILTTNLALAADKPKNTEQVVLPNYTLLSCRTVSCPAVWQEALNLPDAIYPIQISIDIDNKTGRGVVGMTIRYDRTVSFDEIKLSIQHQYGQWARQVIDSPKFQVWRVEPKKFAINLSEEDDGTKRVIYLAFTTLANIYADIDRANGSLNKK